jgi:hypothetical protein
LVQVKNKRERSLPVRPPGVEKTSRLRSRDPVASGVKCGPHGGVNSKMNTIRNYLICDAFSATFSKNNTNVHCSPEHCDDLLNSSRFYDVFLFFVTDVH